MADNDPSELLFEYAGAVAQGEQDHLLVQRVDAYVKARYREYPSIVRGVELEDVVVRLRLKKYDDYADLLEHRLSDEARRLDAATLHGRLHDGHEFIRRLGNEQMVTSRFLIRGELVRSTVAQVVDYVPGVAPEHLWHGSGFVVGENLFMTNHHVLPNKVVAARCRAHFDYVTDLGAKEEDAEVEARYHTFDPERFWYTNEELDYSIVYVNTDSVKGKMGRIPVGLYWNRLYKESPKALPKERVNIIQHPDGGSQRLAMRLNEVTERKGDHFFYTTSTRSGSSGSPVMNDSWQLVGLHQAGADGSNQGIRASVIAEDLENHLDQLDGDPKRLGLTCFSNPPEAEIRKKLVGLFQFLKVVADAAQEGGEDAAQKAGADWVKGGIGGLVGKEHKTPAAV